MKLWNELSTLLSNPVYMICMFAFVVLQFDATGLSFWTISYLQVVLGFEAFDAQMSFIALMLTAPLPAAILGGVLGDAWGGYKGEGMPNALTLCIIFGTCSTTFSLLLSITFD